MKIEFSQNNKLYSKTELSLIQIKIFISKVLKSNDIIDFNKIWIFDDSNNLYAIIDTENKMVKLISNMNFIKSNNFKNKNISDTYYKFICKCWGDLLYLDYNNYPNGSINDLNLFLSKFNESEIQEYIDILFDKNNDDYFDISDWIQEGMRLKNGKQYLNKFVVDNLFGINFKPIKQPLTVYRTFGVYSNNNKSLSYKGWISTSTDNKSYSDNLKFEKFILPVGFCICDTKVNGIFYADNDEIIVRNEDLIQL